MSNPVLILGASSSIARSAANSFAQQGRPIYIAGRDENELERIASDLRIRYRVDVKYGFFDAEAVQNHHIFFNRVLQEMPGLDGVLLAFGELGDQQKGITDFQAAEKVIASNYIGACSILTHCANYLAKRGSGFIIAISSVAGDRGRQSNYIYGSAKAGLSAFLEGLRNRLYHNGVRVITIKPGFVDTPMTYGKPGVFLAASPEEVGKNIANSIHKSKDVVYLPWFWRYIMGIIRILPEFLFKRLKL